jgi:phage shock protein A
MELVTSLTLKVFMPEWLKMLFEKLDNPQRMLESTYQSLQSELVNVRQQCAQAIATEVQLEKKLADKRKTPEEIARLEAELIKQRVTTEALKARLATVESEVQRAYLKKQVWIARQKVQNAQYGPDPHRATLVIIAIMTVWALVGVFINLNCHY